LEVLVRDNLAGASFYGESKIFFCTKSYNSIWGRNISMTIVLRQPKKEVPPQRLSKQDKVLLRNDPSMFAALDTTKLDEISRNWVKYGR